MPVKNIPKKEWKEFIDTFNRKHKNWYASIREMDENNEKRTVEENLKLKEIGLDIEEGEYNNVALILGKKDDEEINHVVMRVKNISLQETDEGADKAIYIDSDRGTTTTLEFRSTLPNEMLNGIAE